jgi:hypothetical protein
MKRLLLPVLGAALVAACSSAPSSGFRGIAVCGTTTMPVIRVDPSFCPIGDGDVPGYGFKWYYEEYPHNLLTSDDVDYPLIQQPINTTVFVGQRPARWGSSSLTVYRDVPLTCGCSVPPGQPPVTHARLSRTQTSTLDRTDSKRTIPAASSSPIQRGGFGSGAARSTTPGAPARRPMGTGTSTSSSRKGK